MDFSRTLSEIVLFFIFGIFVFLITIMASFVFLSLFIQDCLIFIYKRTGEKLWPKKQ